jgi:acetyl esterase
MPYKLPNILSRTIITSTIGLLSTNAAVAQISNTPDIARSIIKLGPNLSRAMVGGTMKLYRPLHAKQNSTGFKLTADQSYGPHERNKLDVYRPANANGAEPILIFAHGGGFVRGDKKGTTNIGRYFSQRGIVTILINYRFAPKNKWPSGAQDIAMAVKWIRENPKIHGGDRNKIFVAGNSAGAMHAADYTFHEDLQIKNDGVIGAILISPPTVDLTTRPVDPKRDALYYGVTGNRAKQSVINALAGRKIPLLIAYAEYEPAIISDQNRRLISALAKRDKRLPLVVSAPGHNHISIVHHIGTADETLGPPILKFIKVQSMEK